MMKTAICARRALVHPRLAVWLAMLLILPAKPLRAQQEADIEEVLVTVEIARAGSGELVALVRQQDVYLSVIELFSLLKIPHQLTPDADSVSGHFLERSNNYLIDLARNELQLGGDRFKLETGSTISYQYQPYIHIRALGRYFQMPAVFNLRSLTITLSPLVELPVVKLMKQAQLRNLLSKTTNIQKADSVLLPEKKWYQGGPLDWHLNIARAIGTPIALGGGLRTTARLAGGLLHARMEKQERSRPVLSSTWHRVLDSSKWIKQVFVGRLPLAPLRQTAGFWNGMQITNRPFLQRQAFGSYRLSQQTEPGWLVELYLNGELINYTEADASGSFAFDVPMVYGTSTLTLKLYSPSGDVVIREQTINIPYNLLPKGVIEYAAAIGPLSRGGMLGKGEVFWGLSQRTTLGVGIEHYMLQQVPVTIPYLLATFRLLPTLLMHAEVAGNQRQQLRMGYSRPRGLQANLGFTWFGAGQQLMFTNALQERHLAMSLPLGRRMQVRTRLAQSVEPKIKRNTLEFGWNATLRKVGVFANVAAQHMGGLWNNPVVNCQLSTRTRKGWLLTSRSQLLLNNGMPGAQELQAEKNYSRKSHFRIVTSWHPGTGASVSAGFRYDLGIMQTSGGYAYNKLGLNGRLGFQGSLIGTKGRGIKAQSVATADKGQLVVYAFLDLNSNGRPDIAEPRVGRLKVQVAGGNIRSQPADTSVWIANLEPNKPHFFRLNGDDFEELAWRLSINSIQATLSPGELRRLYVPVLVAGEVAGRLYIRHNGVEKGVSRITVGIFDAAGVQVGTVRTEQDGFFSYMGLKPGTYKASVDAEQLARMHLKAINQTATFNIRPMPEGDFVQHLDFMIAPDK